LPRLRTEDRPVDAVLLLEMPGCLRTNELSLFEHDDYLGSDIGFRRTIRRSAHPRHHQVANEMPRHRKRITLP
jgi:hypothetical protein